VIRALLILAALTVAGPAFAQVSYTSGPTHTAIAGGIRTTGTLTGTGTLTSYTVLCLLAVANPNAAQTKAGNCGDGNPAIDLEAEVWATGVSNNYDSLMAFPVAKACSVGSNGSNNTSVTCNTIERSPGAGLGIVAIGTLDADSELAAQTVANCDVTLGSALLTGCGPMDWLVPGTRVDLSAGFADLTDAIVECADGSNPTLCAAGQILLEASWLGTSVSSNITVTRDPPFTPAVASSDRVEYALENNKGGNITFGTNGIAGCTEDSPGDGKCTGFEYFEFNVCDVSGVCNMTSGFPAWPERLKVYNGGSRPEIDPRILGPGEPSPLIPPLLFYVGVPLADCAVTALDADDQAVMVSVRTSFPPGTTLGIAGDCTGTPSVQSETATYITIDAMDEGGLYAVPLTVPYWVTDDAITVPTLTDSDLIDAYVDMASARPWLDSTSQLTVTERCEPGADPDEVLSQSPAAGMTVSATAPVAVEVNSDEEECWEMPNVIGELSSDAETIIDGVTGGAVPITLH
jgi:hypothetical protein